MKEYAVGDRIKLNTGETVEVSGRHCCGRIDRRDNLYSFAHTSLVLTGREIEMNTSAYWRKVTPGIFALARRVAL